MFIGTFYHNLDAKNRVKVPRKILERAQKSDQPTRFFLNKGMEGCLFLFTEERWNELTQKLNNLSLGAEKARDFQRMFFASTHEVFVDGSGRILIPEVLKSAAGFKSKVVFLGAGNRVELWDEDKWETRLGSISEGYEEIAEVILETPPGG